jgi:heat-inducible transcriptional repressor
VIELARRKALSDTAINERALHFLKLLVERYIEQGHPIGSRALARDAGLELSPATIRNVMSDLEEMGLVASPHTSAGRVPTVSGYRMFLDCLITLKPLEDNEVAGIQAGLDRAEEPARLIHATSELLSRITSMAGVVRLPRRQRASFRQIEFLQLSGSRVLAILVTNEEEVHNRIIHTKRVYTASELEQAANYLNSKFSGRGLGAVRAELVQEMRDARTRMDQIMERALEMAGQMVAGSGPEDDYMIAGQANLMNFDDLASMDRLRSLFQAFTEKQQILHLLDRCMEAEGVQIFIGGESEYQVLDGCSVVTAPYKLDDQVVGVLGVIGPTRMAYERVIPIVDVTARLLGAALKQR